MPKLANEVGVGESIVRRRLEVLIESGAIRPTALVEPKALGFEIELFVSIRCELGQLERVAQALRAVPTVRFLSATTGVYDLVAEVVLRAEADIYDFYTHTLGTIPGLAGVDMAVEIRTVKRGFIPL